MKVLVNYIGKSGSGPMNAYELAKGLANNGCEVYAVVSKYVVNKNEWDNLDSLKEVYYIETNQKSGFLYYVMAQLYFMLWGKWKLKRHFNEVKFDYVITAMQHLWSIDISKILNKRRIVWLCHDPIPHSGSGRMDEYLGNTFANISDDVVVMSKKFIPLVSSRWNIPLGNIHYMPLGRHNCYTKYYNKNELYSENYYNFLFFGYLREYKGLAVLAEAFKKLKSEYDNVTLTVAGSGDFSPYEEQYKALKDFHLHNYYIDDSKVGKFFTGPNIITVMPYLDGTQSGVSLISMEYGSVIISSDTGGLKEQMDDGNIGIYCNPGDSDDLYKKMKYIIENPQVVAEQKTRMNSYLRKLEWDNVVKILLEDLEK